MSNAGLRFTLGTGNDGEYVRIFPRYGGNWMKEAQGLTPLSVEMRLLGIREGIEFADKFSRQSRKKKTRKERLASYLTAIRTKLVDACKPGSVQGAEAEDGTPMLNIEDIVDNPFAPQDLLTELTEIADDLSRLQEVNADAYRDYLEQQGEGVGEDEGEDEETSQGEFEADNLEEDEAGN